MKESALKQLFSLFSIFDLLKLYTMEIEFTSQTIKLSKLKNNTGQIEGLKKNPRIIKDSRFKKLVESIKASPQFINLRELIAVEHEGSFIVIAGNQRLKALKEIGYTEAPVKVLPEGTPVQFLNEVTIKDNANFGEHDFEELKLNWNVEELSNWGIEVDWNTEEKKKKSSSSLKSMRGNMEKSIKISFKASDFEEVTELIKELREQGIDVGTLIKEALKATKKAQNNSNKE